MNTSSDRVQKNCITACWYYILFSFCNVKHKSIASCILFRRPSVLRSHNFSVYKTIGVARTAHSVPREYSCFSEGASFAMQKLMGFQKLSTLCPQHVQFFNRNGSLSQVCQVSLRTSNIMLLGMLVLHGTTF